MIVDTSNSSKLAGLPNRLVGHFLVRPASVMICLEDLIYFAIYL